MSHLQKTPHAAGFFDDLPDPLASGVDCFESLSGLAVGILDLILAAPDGFEPPMPESESGALPLGYGAVDGLALRVLSRATCLVQTDLLALDFAGVTGHESGFAQRRLQAFVVFDEGASNAEADCASLASRAAASDADEDVEFFGGFDQLQRLTHDHACRLATEEFIKCLAVDRDRTAALAQVHACGGGFATAGAVVCGCWAVCGWFGPA